jgi:hypothetical protein
MSQTVSNLRLVLPLQNGEQELLVPASFVATVMLPGIEHEIGHIVAAAHHNATILGVGVGFIHKPDRSGFFFQSVYGWEAVTIEVQCVVKAAGPAADLMFRGRIDDAAASGDLADIEGLSGMKSLEPYLSEAQAILNRYRPEVGWLSARLRTALLDGQRRTMVLLPNGQSTAFFIDQRDLEDCPDFAR